MHSKFQALEVHDRTPLSDALEIHTIELPKLATSTVSPEDVALVDWAKFFAADTDEERRRLSMSNRDIEQTTKALKQLSQDPKAQELARWREDQMRLYRMELATIARREREEGLLKGREEGRQEGRQEGLLEGLREGQQRTVRPLEGRPLTIDQDAAQLQYGLGAVSAPPHPWTVQAPGTR